MKGIELARAFYEQCGKPMLEEQFADLLPYLAVGLIGSGSECFGFDDTVSADHDFEPGFCIFLPGEEVVDRKQAFALERAYAKLPKEFRGYRRAMLAPVGGARHGVIRTGEWLAEKLGSESGTLTAQEYLRLPEQALAELTNGEVFFDHYGQLSALRENLRCFPEEIRRKKLAGNLLLMAQAGQYNYTRCLKHGEEAAALAQSQARAAFGGSGAELLTKEVSGVETVVDAMVATGVAKSKGEARRLIEQGGVSVDETKVTDVNMPIPAPEFVLHKGKKVHLKVIVK